MKDMTDQLDDGLRPTDVADADLVAMTREGSPEAYAELYRRHHATARRVAARLTVRHEADDVAAESFERVLDQMRRGGGPTDDFRSYLLTSVRHEVIRRGRKASRMVLTDDETTLDRPVADRTGLDLAEADVVRRAFAELPPRWREVLWLIDVEGHRPREVADRLDLRPNSVSALVYRARRALRVAYLEQHAATDLGDDVCRDVRSHLVELVQNQLHLGDHRRVSVHLRSCAACAEVLADLQALDVASPAARRPDGSGSDLDAPARRRVPSTPEPVLAGREQRGA